MNTHYLKTWQPYYDDIAFGLKPFEVRKNDRDYKVGDILVLQEYDNEINKYTGWELPPLFITYILDDPNYAKEGYVVMGLSAPWGLKSEVKNVERLKEYMEAGPRINFHKDAISDNTQ